MMNRKQIGQALILSGMTPDEIMMKSGIPAESFHAIFGSRESGKDPSKLTSESTYNKLAMVIGLQAGMRDYRRDAVIELRFPVSKKARSEWMEAFNAVRTERLSGQLDIAMIHRKSGLFSKSESMLLIYDTQVGLRFVVSHLRKRDLHKLKDVLAPANERDIVMAERDFQSIGSLIANGVYRIAQFNVLLGGRASSYSWEDVKAAAKEFNFTTDDLIDLMVERVHGKSAPGDIPVVCVPVEGSAEQGPVRLRPRLSVVSGSTRQAEPEQQTEPQDEAAVERTGTEG